MRSEEIIGEIEAVVFASGEIVPADKIIEAFDISEELEKSSSIMLKFLSTRILPTR